MMTGASSIAAELKRAGIEVCFCFPGGTISRLLEAMDDAGIRIVVCVNEPGAGHAAQGYFRASGKVAVVVVTSGPGVTNILTSVADSFYDGDSVLYLCGQVATDQMGRHTRQDGFQWCPTVLLARPISLIAIEPHVHVAACVASALEQTQGGPVVVSIPSDLLT
jgi:acetolactate synthase-1/2/3 large subunit